MLYTGRMPDRTFFQAKMLCFGTSQGILSGEDALPAHLPRENARQGILSGEDALL